jgi:CBS domain-containing protein
MRGKRMDVFFGESDQWNHGPLYMALLQRLKAEGCAGATVVRGMAGFGPHSQIRTARLVEIPPDLPIVVSVVDHPDRIARWAEIAASMMAAGVVTISDVEVHFYSAAFMAGVPDVQVREAMSKDPQAVRPESPLTEVVERLRERDYTVLPVVDADGRVVGVVGDHDLLERGLIPGSVDLHEAAGADTLEGTLRALATHATTVRDVMTAPAVTVRDTERLPAAARLMHDRGLKRLPVVDADGRLVGVLGRFDVLSSIAHGYTARTAPATHQLPQEHRTVSEIMEVDVPTVAATTALGEVLERLLASAVHEVIVVGDDRRPLGVVSEADILARADPSERPGILTMLRSRWNRDAERQVRRSYGWRAADVMSAPVVTVRASDPVIAALTLSATKHIKRLPVVDDAGALVGVVSRPAMLAASLDVATATA